MYTIKEDQPIDAWKAALRQVMQKGKDFEDENRRLCREVMHLFLTIAKPSESSVAKPIESLNSFHYWKYPSLDEIKRVTLTTKLAPDYAYSYGPRIFSFQNAVNQINDYVIPLLKETKETRRAMVSIFDPLSDAKLVSQNTPGLIALDFKIRNNQLQVTALIRSNDMFFGWPANIYQSFVIQEYVRKQVGIDVGSLTTFSISAHIFNDQFEFIKGMLGEKA